MSRCVFCGQKKPKASARVPKRVRCDRAGSLRYADFRGATAEVHYYVFRWHVRVYGPRQRLGSLPRHESTHRSLAAAKRAASRALRAAAGEERAS